MFDLIKKMIGNGTDQVTEQDALTAHLALTVLLLEAAHADGECSREEKEQLKATLRDSFGVSEEEIKTLLEKSANQQGEYVDLFRYTHFINQNFSEKQRIKIMESVWKILLLDNHLEAHEDHFAHKLANLMGLNHTELIEAKMRAREQIS